MYHLSVKTVGRSSGRSATGAAAYRAGCVIEDERTGLVFDYRKKRGIEHSELVLPDDAPSWARDRHQLWNAAELAESRKNSTVAREFEIALPVELSAHERNRLAVDFGREIVARHRCAVDVSIHAPDRHGDPRNFHAHILCTTRRLEADGFTEKTRELDDLKTGEVLRWRERFASLQNERLAEAGLDKRVDHRSHAERGLEAEPTFHKGVAVTAMERRGEPLEVGKRFAEIEATNTARIHVKEADVDLRLASADCEKAEKALLAARLEKGQQDGLRAAAFEAIGANVGAADRVIQAAGNDHIALERAHDRIEEAVTATQERRSSLATLERLKEAAHELGQQVREVADKVAERLQALVEKAKEWAAERSRSADQARTQSARPNAPRQPREPKITAKPPQVADLSSLASLHSLDELNAKPSAQDQPSQAKEQHEAKAKDLHSEPASAPDAERRPALSTSELIEKYRQFLYKRIEERHGQRTDRATSVKNLAEREILANPKLPGQLATEAGRRRLIDPKIIASFLDKEQALYEKNQAVRPTQEIQTRLKPRPAPTKPPTPSKDK